MWTQRRIFQITTKIQLNFNWKPNICTKHHRELWQECHQQCNHVWTFIYHYSCFIYIAMIPGTVVFQLPSISSWYFLYSFLLCLQLLNSAHDIDLSIHLFGNLYQIHCSSIILCCWADTNPDLCSQGYTVSISGSSGIRAVISRQSSSSADITSSSLGHSLHTLS